MNLDDEVEEKLRQRTRNALEQDLTETDPLSNEGPRLKHKSGEKDEKIERQAFSKTGASMTPQQVEYLVRERTDMDNKELEKFLAGEHEASEVLADWSNFSRTEEKYMIQNYQKSGPEEMAERLDRSKEVIEIKLKLMGLNPENM